MSDSSGAKATSFLHHNQTFHVIIEKSDCDIKNLIIMQKALGLLAHFNWTSGQGKHVVVVGLTEVN